MHEVGIAAEILAIVQSTAHEAGLSSVTRIKVVIGNQRMIIPDALLFAFSYIKQDSCARTAIMEIESRVGRDLFIDFVEGE